MVEFEARVCEIAESLPSTCVGNHVGGQLIRCAVSPGPNYAEAQGAESRRDFIHKLKVCLKELRETQAWLQFIHRPSLASDHPLEAVIRESDELISIIVASVTTAQRNGAMRNPSQPC